jgi:hypothetical protein
MSQHKRSLVVSLLGACALLFGVGLLLAQPAGAAPSDAVPSAPASTSAAGPEPSYSIGDAISTSRAVPSYGIGSALSTSRAASRTKPVAARPRTNARTSTSAVSSVARHVEVAQRSAIVGRAPATVHEDGVARTGRPIIEYVVIGLLFIAVGTVVFLAARRLRGLAT